LGTAEREPWLNRPLPGRSCRGTSVAARIRQKRVGDRDDCRTDQAEMRTRRLRVRSPLEPDLLQPVLRDCSGRAWSHAPTRTVRLRPRCVQAARAW